MLRRHQLCFVCVALLLVSLAGCSMFRGKTKRTRSTGESGIAVQVDTVEYPATLHAAVQRNLDAVAQRSVADRARVIRRKPYWYKTYSEYGDIPVAGDLDIQDSVSRTVPYRADVRVKKVRFATQLRQTRDAARLDTHFIRDTGEEIMSYEFRSGQWHRVGSLFVAEKSEEELDGEWIAVRRAEPRTLSEVEEQAGWFKGLRNRLPWRD